MRCENCEIALDKSWNFCPNCGLILRREGLEKIERIALQELDRIGRTLFSMLGIPAKISVKMSGKSVEEEKEHSETMDILNQKMELQEIEEPDAVVNKANGRTLIKVILPEVNENSIKISKMEQSIEIRACSNNKAYFKLIPIPSRSKILKSELKDNILEIEISA